MHLTDHTEYSLRVLMYLNQTKKLATLNDLSKELGISRNNLIKVSRQLSKFGYVEATRGRSGGLIIKKETGKTTLRDIISRTEESFCVIECFVKKNYKCRFSKNCQFNRSIRVALEAFFDSLNQITLNDVTPCL